MKYILTIAFMFLSLGAQIENKQMYAQVTSMEADLYIIPSENGTKKAHYFKKGDMIPIEYCDKSNWCKTPDGYVKKKLLLIPEPILRNVVVMPKYKTEMIKEVQSQPVILTRKITHVELPLVKEKQVEVKKYAKIRSKYANLYNIPNQDAQRKVNYFKEGDLLNILYCDKNTWCKTSNGYVKKELLHILKPTVAETPQVVVVKEKKVTQNILHDNSILYAKLLPIKANLYVKPHVDARQSIGYFQKGDSIKIDYCDNYGWCKTTNGYIRQDDIVLSSALLREAKARQNTQPREYTSYKTPRLEKRVVLQQKPSHLKDEIIVTKTKYIQVVEDIGAYAEYFKDDSAKVVFTRSQ